MLIHKAWTDVTTKLLLYETAFPGSAGLDLKDEVSLVSDGVFAAKSVPRSEKDVASTFD